jgi:hypothetical protein
MAGLVSGVNDMLALGSKQELLHRHALPLGGLSFLFSILIPLNAVFHYFHKSSISFLQKVYNSVVFFSTFFSVCYTRSVLKCTLNLHSLLKNKILSI